MSGPLPNWVATATEPSEAEVSSLFGSQQPELAQVASEATEPLRDEVESLIRRCISHRDDRVRWQFDAVLGRRLLLLALFALVILGVTEVREQYVDLTSNPPIAQASYTTEGRGSWTQHSRDADGVYIEQIDGVVRYRVDPLPSGQRFRVRARTVEVEVVGTVFDVGIEGGTLWVEVIEGKVRVSDGAVRTLLVAGESWRGEGRELPATSRHAPQMILSSSRSAERALPADRNNSIPSSNDSPVSNSPIEASEPSDTAHHAANYAALLGRVDDGERSEELVAALEAFATETDGPLSDAALVTAIEVSADVRPPEVVIGTIDWFLSTRPRTVHRKYMLELRGDLARNRMQSCERALPSYRELAGTSSGAQQARAEALRGLCAASIGRVNEARTALLSSLQLGIGPPLWSEVHAALDALE